MAFSAALTVLWICHEPGSMCLSSVYYSY